MIDNMKEKDILKKASEINSFDVIMCLSTAIDLVSPEISGHHIRVAYIAYNIAKQCRLKKEQIDKLVIAACIHDIGAITAEERKEILKSDYESNGKHEELGYYYAKKSKVFSIIADIIRYHHTDWDYGKKEGVEIPIESQILHLADRVDTYLDRNKTTLQQVKGIVSSIEEKGEKYFNPKQVEAFKIVAKNEAFWLYLISNNLPAILKKEVKLPKMNLNIDDYSDLAKWFTRFIDFRSRFTSIHSTGVAQTAKTIAEKMNLSPLEVKIIEISGFLHDIGKLAVPNSILEKEGKLDELEFSIIKTHTFYTFNVLKGIKQFNYINKYAAYHHEHIDGSGYPFHIKGRKMLVGCRIMCVADIFTAISEDRPYRKGMSKDEIIQVISSRADDKHLDSSIAKIAIDNIDLLINNMRKVELEKKADIEEFFSKKNK